MLCTEKPVLCCPVCQKPLIRGEKNYCCEEKHSFDIARDGYVNLLLGTAGTHGDNRLMIAARQSFLNAGFYCDLATAYAAMLQKLPLEEGAVLLDAGCGEGYYLSVACTALAGKNLRFLGFDISKDALHFASKRNLPTSLFVASAYRVPVLPGKVSVLSLFFSPFCREEILRMLKPGGFFIMAIPGEKHLFSLKKAIYDAPYPNKPHPFALDGFTLLSHRHTENNILLSSQEEIQALFAMTPYYYKTSERDRQKLSVLEELKTETSFELLLYRKD